MPDQPRLPRRRLRLFLRDFRLVEGYAHMPSGLTLASYLANRKGYLHLVDLRWQTSGETAPFAVLRVAQLLYVASRDPEIPVVNVSPTAVPHPVEMLLEGGLRVRGGVVLGQRQRLSDYLESAGGFLPVIRSELLQSGRPPRECNVRWGDVVVNQDAIQAVWDGERSDSRRPDGVRIARAVVDESL